MAAIERWRKVRERLAKAQYDFSQNLEETKSRFEGELVRLCDSFQADLATGAQSDDLLEATADDVSQN